MEKNIEERVKEVVLSEIVEVEVEGLRYKIKPICAADFIRISALVSRLKEIDIDSLIVERNMGVTHAFVFENAEVISMLADIAAIGLSKVKQGWVRCLFTKILPERKWEALVAQSVLKKHTPHGVSVIATEVLKTTQIDFFLGTMVFLKGLNLLKKTGTNKKEKETTASGQSLEDLQELLD